MNLPRARTALIYDFDGTLARGNIQEHSFIPKLGVDASSFWSEVRESAKEHDADEILTYMWRMLELAKAKGIPITKAALKEHGQQAPLFDGLATWFERIEQYGSPRGLEIEHYVISSGIYEMICGCSVFERFKRVYASKFIYNKLGEAIWPGVAINYTTKTQFLFRINKGIDNTWDNQQINRWIPMAERPVPFERIVFIGDGETDIPSMKMVRYQGGHSIAVYDPARGATDNIYRLISEDRVHFVAPADYSEDSQLEVTIKGILGRVARNVGFRE
jgi:hypothetical protein